MTSLNSSKLLVLDINFHQINLSDLHTYFSTYDTIESIERHTNSVVITFVNEFIIEHLIAYRTCLIKQNRLRLRRYRFDSNNWHIDSQTLFIKLSLPIYPTNVLTETTIYQCFQNNQIEIIKIHLIDHNQALISFKNYDFVDRILLMPMHMFVINDVPLVFERMMSQISRISRWDQPEAPILSNRDPVVYKLLRHIECLSKQLREQPNHLRNEIERLEAEIFILKNENAKLKSKENLSTKQNLEQRLIALEDLSNRYLSSNKSRRRQRSQSQDKHSKRRRKYQNENDY